MPKTDLKGINDLSTLHAADIDSIANKHGKDFASTIKTNQVRNIYSNIMALKSCHKMEKKFSTEIERSLILIKPKMAYAAGRQSVVKPFYELMVAAIDGVKQSQNKETAFLNFLALFEAVVAYHKFYGGKEK